MDKTMTIRIVISLIVVLAVCRPCRRRGSRGYCAASAGYSGLGVRGRGD